MNGWFASVVGFLTSPLPAPASLWFHSTRFSRVNPSSPSTVPPSSDGGLQVGGCFLLAQARQKGLTAASVESERLPFADGTFDRVLMVDALHHVVHQGETVRELFRVLKPGGRLVIEEPDSRTFAVKLIAIAEKIALMRSHFLSPPQIASLLPPAAKVRVEAEEHTAWVIAEK